MRRPLIRILLAVVILITSFGLGFLASSDLVAERIRREAEQQLTRLLGGPVRIERVQLGVRLGLLLEGHEARAWTRGSEGPSLTVGRVTASVSPTALLTGRFRLRWLRLTDARVVIERDADGHWEPEPLIGLLSGRRRGEPEPAEPPERLEPGLRLARGLRGVARALLEEPRVAPLIEVENSTVIFADARPGGPEAPPVVLRLDHLNGRLEHHWFGGAELSLRADLVGETGRPIPFELEGRREGANRYRVTLANTGADLRLLESYATLIHPRATLSGEASGVFVFASEGEEEGTLELDWLVRDLRTAVPRPQARTLAPIETKRVKLRAMIELQSDRLHVSEARLSAGALALDANAVIRRPLGAHSPARVAATLESLGLPEIRSVLGWLPETLREPVVTALERIEAGRIEGLGVRGSGRLTQWRGLLSGDTAGGLPQGFVVHATAADVAVRVGPDDLIHALNGVVEWSEDTLVASDVEGRLNGEPLPRLDVRVSRISSFVAAARNATPARAEAGTLPGLPALLRILEPPEPDPALPRPDPPPLTLWLDHIDHPALLWPMQNVRASVERAENHLHVSIAEATWAGVPIRGETHWVLEPVPTVSTRIEALGPATGEPAESPSGEWVSGRLEAGPFDGGPTSPRSVRTTFRASGNTVTLERLVAPIAPRGELRLDGSLDLGQADVVGTDLEFALKGLDVGAAEQRLGRSAGSASGTLDLVGTLAGPVRPDEPFLAGLEGVATAGLRDGELKWKLPILASIALAGDSLFGSRDSVRYDQAEAVFDLDRGLLRTDAFALEGPDLRLAGRGSLQVVREPHALDLFVGISLLRPIDAVVGKVPLLRLLRGRDRNLIGAYFSVTGTWEDPQARLTPFRGLTAELSGFLEQVPRLPDGGNGS